ncbi:uncharacterized protein N7487_006789 [Penicillium crustosum]|uniref:uncharacterized protein n=1 Tax=Penicillium crustosum TaxID=36656 RepID=UPI002392F06A|nr:uncharacterized protein N7487_006789 [Penicillium crustosum]KAJ5412430.1 hypothetical protein N7487_006789 [Penicillium crustosum]
MNPRDIIFEPFNMYNNEPENKTSIINLIVCQPPAGARSATVVNEWHTSRKDKRVHCTVDYCNTAGNLIRRHHIV